MCYEFQEKFVIYGRFFFCNGMSGEADTLFIYAFSNSASLAVFMISIAVSGLMPCDTLFLSVRQIARKIKRKEKDVDRKFINNSNVVNVSFRSVYI